MRKMELNVLHEPLKVTTDSNHWNRANGSSFSNMSIYETSSNKYYGPELILTIFQIVILVLITSFSVTINSLVLVVFYRKPSLRSKSNRFVLNLSVCNFLMGISLMPLNIMNTYKGIWTFGMHLCDLTSGLFTALICTSAFTLLCITLDRYYAVTQPLHYRRKQTVRKIHIYIILVWLSAIIFATILIVGFKNQYNDKMKTCFIIFNSTGDVPEKIYVWTFLLLCFIVPLTFMLWIYIQIFGATKRSTAKARKYSINCEKDDIRSTIIPKVHLFHHVINLRPYRMKKVYIRLFHKDDWKAAITGFICVSTFALTWIPFFSIIALESSVNISLPQWTWNGAMNIAFLSCVLNPLVYVFRSKFVKREMVNLLRRKGSTLSSSSFHQTGCDASGVVCSPVRQKAQSREISVVNTDKPRDLEFLCTCKGYST